jgi:hypothetical protein
VATEPNYYVNTASTAGGDGTTNATSGATRAFVSAAEAESGISTSLTSHVTVHFSGSADTGGNANWNGFGTSATKTMTFIGNTTSGDGFNDTGIFDNVNFYTYQHASGNGFQLNDDYQIIEGMQFEATGTGESDGIVHCHNKVNLHGPHISKSIFKDSRTGAGYCTEMVTNPQQNATYPVIVNSIFIGNNHASGNCFDTGRNGCGIYNCVITNFADGVDDGNIIVKNSALFDNADDFTNYDTSDYNASDDGDGTNTVDISPGVEATNWAEAFNDYGSYDFQPITGSVLLAEGLGSATDSKVPTDDYFGVTRSTSAPTIGAFELVIASSFVPQVIIF